MKIPYPTPLLYTIFSPTPPHPSSHYEETPGRRCPTKGCPPLSSWRWPGPNMCSVGLPEREGKQLFVWLHSLFVCLFLVCLLLVCLPAFPPACLPVCLPECLPKCLSACLSACLPACLSVCWPVCLSACLPACPACLFACVPVCLPVCLPACLPVCLVCLSVCVFVLCPVVCFRFWCGDSNSCFVVFGWEGHLALPLLSRVGPWLPTIHVAGLPYISPKTSTPETNTPSKSQPKSDVSTPPPPPQLI